jgi:hypothetical protein
MADRLKCTWTGGSGKGYEYFIYDLPTTFTANQAGSYIFSRKNDKGRWVPIYIGQGDLADRISDDHHQANCIKKKGATHVHVHLSPKEKDRTAEEEDLLANYTNAYKPDGCNVREGG